MNSFPSKNQCQETVGRIYYRCVQCHSAIETRGDDSLICGVCRAIYPSIEGVKVLSSNPTELLQLCMKRLSDARKQVIELKARLASTNTERYSQTAISLAAGGCDGQLENLTLIEQVMRPVQEYLSSQSGQNSRFSNFHAVEGGWSCLNMIDYFYRDWGNTDEARFLTDLFTDAMKEYCGNDRKVAVVLGCGAGKLVYDVAEVFPVVSGLDLSIDTLLLAKLLLDGEKFDLHFNLPNNRFPISQKTVSLNGPAQKRAGIELVSADVKRLPFVSSSVSCVLTSYLLDITSDPSAVVAEIYRVLAPKGIWINFSNLNQYSNLSDDESFEELNYLDMPSYLRRSGFNFLTSARHRFKLIDRSVISEWAHTYTETPVFFVAERDLSQDSERTDYFVDYFAGNEKSTWQSIPQISRPIALRQEKVFTGHGIEERKMVGLPNAGTNRAIKNEDFVAFEWLLRNIDGTHTTREIIDLINKVYGDIAETDELIKFFRKLHESGIIKFK